MIKYLELALSQEVYEYLEELDQMNWSARGNVLNQYLRNTSIGTTVNVFRSLGSNTMGKLSLYSRRHIVSISLLNPQLYRAISCIYMNNIIIEESNYL
jgi:hypothetical protein